MKRFILKTFFFKHDKNTTSKLVSGFTLIELLTVIAIIGILSSIVYVSLSQFRLKSKDTVVKSQLSGMRVQAELYFGIHNNSYINNINSLNLCTDSSTSERGFGGATGGLLKATNDATAITSYINYGAGDWNKVTCHVSVTGDKWAVEAPLSTSVSGHPVMFCVDSRTITPKESTPELLGVSNDTTCD